MEDLHSGVKNTPYNPDQWLFAAVIDQMIILMGVIGCGFVLAFAPNLENLVFRGIATTIHQVSNFHNL